MTEETNKASGADVDPLDAIAAVKALIAERDALRAILSKCATAIGNGASVATDSSIEFLSLIPEEIALSAGKLREALVETTDVLECLRRGHGAEISAACYPALNNARDALARTSPGAPK